jgi:hypothetical protein
VGSLQVDAGTALLAIDWLTRTVRAALLLPPLPAAHAPTLSAPEVMMRAATDSAGTLDNRLIIVTGFTMAGDGDTDLGRMVIICCAADAQRGPHTSVWPSRHRRGELPRGHMVADRRYQA